MGSELGTDRASALGRTAERERARRTSSGCASACETLTGSQTNVCVQPYQHYPMSYGQRGYAKPNKCIRIYIVVTGRAAVRANAASMRCNTCTTPVQAGVRSRAPNSRRLARRTTSARQTPVWVIRHIALRVRRSALRLSIRR